MKSIRSLNDEKILLAILYNEPNGVSNREVEDITCLNHDTVSTHCKNLVKKDLITKKNKKGKYHLTEKSYGYNIIRSNLFKNKAIVKIPNLEVLDDMKNAFPKILKNTRAHNSDLVGLLAFSNRIGAFVTYVIMDAIRPNKWGSTININKSKRITRNKMGGENKDRLVIEWIQRLIDPKTLLWFFSKIPFLDQKPYNGKVLTPPPRRFLRPPDYDSCSEDERRMIDEEIEKTLEAWLNEFSSDSNWQLGEREYIKLVKVFKELYPTVYNELKGITDGLDDEVKQQVSYQSDWKHTKCKGKMKIIKEN
jgi:predicted transcriptional regulator